MKFAIAGGSVAHPVLASMLADLDLGPLIRTLFDRGILVVEGQTYHLSHALMREAVLEDSLGARATVVASMPGPEGTTWIYVAGGKDRRDARARTSRSPPPAPVHGSRSVAPA